MTGGESVDVGDVATERDGEVNVVTGLTSQLEEPTSSYRPHLEAVDNPDLERTERGRVNTGGHR
ncbi:hypothetical protein [Rhodococcus sp. T7]|uniref:hypothetical protein n=1 Tax=Rhodococcus sp. T7 TaxID=627444 RepID=UPI0013C874A8|nr:hypothetical protein [Rhodococcus sp. T7]KAF0957180.1 hypothetical protein MLGJGCBP_09010 [Rhodococcus sp. T7]KAF0959018.1 hypothetical protein MLGJGCBP_07895 [Rhodococcus sp. T7]